MSRNATKNASQFTAMSQREMLARFEKAADKFDADITRNPNEARAKLIQRGILTKTGKLSKRYGG